MAVRNVSGRMPSGSQRGGMRANSKLPKGNQYTTPERESERQKKREKKAAELDPAYLFGANPAELREGRTRVRQFLTEDPMALKRVVEMLLEKAEAGSYKHAELVMAYYAGKPIAMSESVSVELTGDDLFEATESVRERLTRDDITVIEGGRSDEPVA